MMIGTEFVGVYIFIYDGTLKTLWGFKILDFKNKALKKKRIIAYNIFSRIVLLKILMQQMSLKI